MVQAPPNGVVRFRHFDGSGRAPFQTQKDILTWLHKVWDTPGVKAINAPTGVGKSAVLMTLLQHARNTVGIVPSNLLLSQYLDVYPGANNLRGLEHYQCQTIGATCQDKRTLNKEPCKACPYTACKSGYLCGEPTLFNPISYHIMSMSLGKKRATPEILVVDEAHKFLGMVMLVTGAEFSKREYRYPNIHGTAQLLAWLKKLPYNQRNLEKVRHTIEDLETCPQDMVVYTEKRGPHEYLIIKPIRPPASRVKRLLESKKLVLLSATLFETDLWDMGIRDYQYLDVASPIPVSQRPVLYRPAPVAMGYDTNPQAVAKWIRDQLQAFPGRNTIVHVSYAWAERLRKHFPEALSHTPETKDETLRTFKSQGGLWLAAGCAEGIDLPGDEARLNLIPMLQFGNPTDPTIRKRLAQADGKLQYDMHTLKTLIQQVGRTTRGVDDHSITVVGDSRFPQLYNRRLTFIPKSFREAVQWQVKST